MATSFDAVTKMESKETFTHLWMIRASQRCPGRHYPIHAEDAWNKICMGQAHTVDEGDTVAVNWALVRFPGDPAQDAAWRKRINPKRRRWKAESLQTSGSGSRREVLPSVMSPRVDEQVSDGEDSEELMCQANSEADMQADTLPWPPVKRQPVTPTVPDSPLAHDLLGAEAEAPEAPHGAEAMLGAMAMAAKAAAEGGGGGGTDTVALDENGWQKFDDDSLRDVSPQPLQDEDGWQKFDADSLTDVSLSQQPIFMVLSESQEQLEEFEGFAGSGNQPASSCQAR